MPAVYAPTTFMVTWIGAREVGAKVQVGGVKLQAGTNGPKAYFTYTSGGKTQTNSSVWNIGAQAFVPFGKARVGVTAGNGQFPDGKSSVKMASAGGNESLGISKTVKSSKLSETGSQIILNINLSVEAKVGIIGVQVSVNIYQSGKALANSIGTFFNLVGGYLNEKINDILQPQENIPNH